MNRSSASLTFHILETFYFVDREQSSPNLLPKGKYSQKAFNQYIILYKWAHAIFCVRPILFQENKTRIKTDKRTHVKPTNHQMNNQQDHKESNRCKDKSSYIDHKENPEQKPKQKVMLKNGDNLGLVYEHEKQTPSLLRSNEDPHPEYHKTRSQDPGKGSTDVWAFPES